MLHSMFIDCRLKSLPTFIYMFKEILIEIPTGFLKIEIYNLILKFI